MSQDQSNVSNGTLNGQPKRFLKKGEGLKRFAAYKPPPPTTTTKTQRRQTFVRFKLDNKLKRDQHYLHPDILLDDSINLSTEIPKIAPPKIMHTPIRPNHRLALGTLNPQESQNIISDSQINGNIDNLLKKIQERKSSLEKEERNEAFLFASPTMSNQGNDKNIEDVKNNIRSDSSGSDGDDRDNYDEGASELSDSVPQRVTKAKSTAQQKLKRPQRKPTVVDKQSQVSPTFDLSTPAPGNCIIALGRQIQQIQETVNELKEKIKHCECGALASQPTTRRPTTRSQAKAKSTTSDKTNRPSADADNNNPTIKLLNCLNSKIDQLRENFEGINLDR